MRRPLSFWCWSKHPISSLNLNFVWTPHHVSKNLRIVLIMITTGLISIQQRKDIKRWVHGNTFQRFTGIRFCPRNECSKQKRAKRVLARLWKSNSPSSCAGFYKMSCIDYRQTLSLLLKTTPILVLFYIFSHLDFRNTPNERHHCVPEQ